MSKPIYFADAAAKLAFATSPEAKAIEQAWRGARLDSEATSEQREAAQVQAFKPFADDVLETYCRFRLPGNINIQQVRNLDLTKEPKMRPAPMNAGGHPKPSPKQAAAQQHAAKSKADRKAKEKREWLYGDFTSKRQIMRIAVWLGRRDYDLTWGEAATLQPIAELARAEFLNPDPKRKKNRPSSEITAKVAELQLAPPVVEWLLRYAYALEDEPLSEAQFTCACAIMKARYFYIPVGQRVYRIPDRRAISESDVVADMQRWFGESVTENAIKRRLRARCLQADDIVRLPGKPTRYFADGKWKVNLWHETALIPITVTDDDEDIALFVAHLLFILKTEANVKAFLDWLAYLVQNPTQRNRWCWVIGSIEEQLGKGWIVRVIGKMFGAANIAKAAKKELKEDSNAFLTRGTFVYINEALLTFSTVETLKEAITDDVVPVRKLYQDAFDLEHRTSFIISSNNANALAISETNVRFMVVFNSAKRKDDAYYDRLMELSDGPDWKSNEDGTGMGRLPAKLLSFLARRDLSGHSPNVRPFATDDELAMIETVRSSEEKDVAHLIRIGAAPFNGEIVEIESARRALLDPVNGPGIKITANALGRALQSAGAVRLDLQRIRFIEANGKVSERRAYLWALKNSEAWAALDGEEGTLARGAGIELQAGIADALAYARGKLKVPGGGNIVAALNAGAVPNAVMASWPKARS